jgi:hypothetical protein
MDPVLRAWITSRVLLTAFLIVTSSLRSSERNAREDARGDLEDAAASVVANLSDVELGALLATLDPSRYLAATRSPAACSATRVGKAKARGLGSVKPTSVEVRVRRPASQAYASLAASLAQLVEQVGAHDADEIGGAGQAQDKGRKDQVLEQVADLGQAPGSILVLSGEEAADAHGRTA